MTRPAKIGAAAALEDLPGWEADPSGRDAIRRTFRFTDFNAAFGFMSRAALMAEKLDHHPEWFNGYNRFEVTPPAHDSGCVPVLDSPLARFLDQAAEAGG